MLTLDIPNDSRMRLARASTAFSPRMMLAATLASVSASAAERVAARLRDAAWSTTTLTSSATARKISNKTKWAGLAIRNWYSGATKKKSTQNPVMTAAVSAGQIPPARATTTTKSWKASTSATSASGVRNDASSQVSSGRPTRVRAKPLSTRRRVRAPRVWGSCSVPAEACETM
jgi:hypothetical protein